MAQRVDFEYRLAVSALVLANKFLEDHTYTAKTWASLTQLGSPSSITKMELAFWRGLGYNIHVTPQQLASFKTRTEILRAERLRMIRQLAQQGLQGSLPASPVSPRTVDTDHRTLPAQPVSVSMDMRTRPLGLPTPPSSPYDPLNVSSSAAVTAPSEATRPGAHNKAPSTVPTCNFNFTPPSEALAWPAYDECRTFAGMPMQPNALAMLHWPSAQPLQTALSLQLQAQEQARGLAQAMTRARAQAQAQALARVQFLAQMQAQAANIPQLQAMYGWMRVHSAQVQAQAQGQRTGMSVDPAQTQANVAAFQVAAQAQAQTLHHHVALSGM